MTSQEKKNKKIQEKMNKLAAQQEKLNNGQGSQSVEPVQKPTQTQDLPVFNRPLYDNEDSVREDLAKQGEVLGVSINERQEPVKKTEIAKNKGYNVSKGPSTSVDKLLYEGEKSFLTGTNEQEQEVQKPKKKASLLDSLFGSSGSKSKKPNTKIPKTVQETIPYEFVYKNGIIEVEPGLYSKSYVLADVNFKIATDEEQENMFLSYGSLLNMFDAETQVEVTIFNRNVNRELFKEKTLLKLKGDGLDKYRIENNAILEAKMNEGKNNIFHEKYLTISVPADSIELAVKKFQSLDTEISAHIKRINGVETFPMSIEERLAVLHEIYNPGSELPLDSEGTINGHKAQTFSLDALKSSGISSKDAIAPSYIEIAPNHMVIGDKYCRTMFIENLPTFLSTDLLSELTDVSCNMITSVYYQPLRQDKTLKLLKNQIVNIDSNVMDAQKKATKSGYSPDLINHDLRKAQEEAERIMEDVTSRNQKMFLMTLVISVYADSLDELDRYCDTVKTTASKFLCSLKKLTYQQEHGFATALPLGNNKLFIQRLLTTEAASVFIPFSAQELSQENGMYYGLNAVSRNLILFNRINSKNANGVILGTPGSGKSFSAKREIINVILGTNDDVYIIDPEREYAPLAALFNGEVIRIAAGSKTYINPLDMDLDYADDDDPITLKSDFLGSICETVLGGKYGLSPIQKTVIDRCVRQVYQPYLEQLRLTNSNLTCDKSIMPTLDDFYQVLLAQPEPESQQIALALELYCRGSFDTFAHRTNVNTNARFVVYDIKDIGTGMKEMGLQVCLNDIWNKIIENHKKGKRTWFYIDEFYLLTQTDSSAKFLQQIYKRARKWGGVPTGITQNVEDLLASREARGIINNCDFIMMLNQSPLDRAELGSMLNISPAQMSYITNSDAGQGLLYTGKFIVPFIDKFPTDNSLYQAMTTKPEDVNLEEFTIQGEE